MDIIDHTDEMMEQLHVSGIALKNPADLNPWRTLYSVAITVSFVLLVF